MHWSVIFHLHSRRPSVFSWRLWASSSQHSSFWSAPQLPSSFSVPAYHTHQVTDRYLHQQFIVTVLKFSLNDLSPELQVGSWLNIIKYVHLLRWKAWQLLFWDHILPRTSKFTIFYDCFVGLISWKQVTLSFFCCCFCFDVVKLTRL